MKCPIGAMQWTRRTVLSRTATTASTALVGCLSRTESRTEPPGSPAVEARQRAETVTLAHWCDGLGTAEVVSAIDERLPRSVDLALSSFATRRELEATVASALVAGSPPGTFQTVAGPELERYVRAVTLHTIDDIVTEDRREGIRNDVLSTILLDGDPYAVPMTVDPCNSLFVRPALLAEVGVEPGNVSDPVALVERLSTVRADPPVAALALPGDGAWPFRLLCQLLLARSGPDAYRAIATGDGSIVTLREAVRALATLLDGSVKVTTGLDRALEAFLAGRAVAMLGDRRVARRLAGADETPWSVHPFPGTAASFVVDVTACGFPKRTATPRGTAELLGALASSTCQTAIAGATFTLPAVETATLPDILYTTALAGAYADAERVIPALSTGCGLDPDARRRASALVDPAVLQTRGVDAMTDRLRAVLP